MSKELDDLVDKCRRAMKNKNENHLTRCKKRLRELGKLDILISDDINLLMYYVMAGQSEMIGPLLTGHNPASVLALNQEGHTALFLAVTCFCGAISSTNIQVIDELLKYSPEKQVLLAANNGDIPLHEALRAQNQVLAEKLLQFSPTAQLNHINKDELNAFDIAYATNNQSLTQWLCIFYPQIRDMTSEDDFTPLHRACQTGDIWLMRLLLLKSPEKQVVAKDYTGAMPLDIACEYNHFKIAEVLLKYVPDQQLLHESQLGNVIFTTLIHGSEETFELIIKCAREHTIPLQELLLKQQDMQPISDPSKYDFDFLQDLLDKTYQIDAETIEKMKGEIKSGMSLKNCFPLSLAIVTPKLKQEQKLRIIKTLLQIGGEKQLELEVQENECALHIAIKLQNLQIIELLTSYPNKNQFLLENDKGEIPLYCALKYNINIDHTKNAISNSIITLLMKRGPQKQFEQLEMMKEYETHPLLLGITRNHLGFVESFLENKTTQYLLDIKQIKECLSISILFPNILEEIIKIDQQKDLLNLKLDEFGNTLVHSALLGFGNIDALTILIRYGANLEKTTSQGWTPLHIACSKNNLEYFYLLLQHTPNLDLILNEGFSPLHIACSNGNLQIAKTLIEKGANVSCRNKKGITPLILAIMNGHHEIIQLLLNQKTDLSLGFVVENHYVTPLMIAIMKYDMYIFRLLLQSGADIYQSIIFQEEGSINLLQLILSSHYLKGNLYQEFIKILKEYNIISDQSTENKEEFVRIISDEPQKFIMSSRRYLREMGYTEEDIQAFNEEREKNKIASKKRYYQLGNNAPLETIFYWDNNSFCSNDNFIFPIMSPSGQAYFYLDKEALVAQGCDISKLDILRLKFGGQHIKKLEASKGEYSEWVKFPNRPEPEKFTYSHELKINQIDRIILFPLKADNGNASLYCGIRFLPGGLHTQGKISSLSQSLKLSSKENYIKIYSPNVAVTPTAVI